MENKYHFKVPGELVQVGEIKELRPDHKEVRGVIKVAGQGPEVCMLPVVAYNKMAEAMVDKMKTGCSYNFSGYFLGSGNPVNPKMLLQVCWTDRIK